MQGLIQQDLRFMFEGERDERSRAECQVVGRKLKWFGRGGELLFERGSGLEKTTVRENERDY